MVEKEALHASTHQAARSMRALVVSAKATAEGVDAFARAVVQPHKAPPNSAEVTAEAVDAFTRAALQVQKVSPISAQSTGEEGEGDVHMMAVIEHRGVPPTSA
jgi:hypothetical protein